MLYKVFNILRTYDIDCVSSYKVKKSTNSKKKKNNCEPGDCVVKSDPHELDAGMYIISYGCASSETYLNLFNMKFDIEMNRE